MNAYVLKYGHLIDSTSCIAFQARREASREFAFAVPTHESILAFKEVVRLHGLRGVLEVGAGTGFWASLIAAEGLDVRALEHEGDRAEWKFQNEFHPLEMGDSRWIKEQIATESRSEEHTSEL